MKNKTFTLFSFEKYFFLLLVLLHVLPVLTLSYYVTHDGPAHIYNSNLVTTLLFSKSSSAANFFQFTHEVIPNWIGHFLLGVFHLFLPASLAEKTFLTVYIILLPLSFRKLVLSVNENAIWASYLIFPFIQSFTFHIGFYSFSIGICVLLFVLAYWNKNKEIDSSRKMIVLMTAMIVLYFSHLFVFLTAIFSMTAMMVWERFLTHRGSMKSFFPDTPFLKKIFLLVLSALVPLILTCFFLLQQSIPAHSQMPNRAYVAEWFSDVRPLIALDYTAEKIFAKPLFYVYMVIFMASMAVKIRAWKINSETFLKVNDSWLILSLIMLLAFFFVPDDMASGGVIGIRFCLMSYLFLFLFIAAYSPGIFLISGAIASVIVSFLLINERYESLDSLSTEATDFASCSDYIKSGSTLLPLNYSENWMLNNMADYIGADKEIIILDNYEASQVHFPLRWKKGMNPYQIVGNFGTSHRPCVELAKLKQVTGINLDYVLVMEKPDALNDSCSLNIDKQLAEQYDLIYTTPQKHGRLYFLKGGLK